MFAPNQSLITNHINVCSDCIEKLMEKIIKVLKKKLQLF